MNKILYIDTETTGLIKYVHGIIQIAYIIEIDGKVKKRGSFKINPRTYNRQIRVTAKALEINGFTIKDFDKFSDSKEVLYKFIDILKKYGEGKFKLVAYNANFDAGFIQEWFKDGGREDAYSLLIDYRHLDPFELFKYLVYSGKINYKFKSYSLEKACLTMGLEFVAHEAVADIEATRDLHLHLLEMIK